eukprot:scaffold2596_cov394-Pavlova_lutheri.AAC.1
MSRVLNRVAPGTRSTSPLLCYQAATGRLPLIGRLYPHSLWASMLGGRDPTEVGPGARRGPVQARLCYRLRGCTVSMRVPTHVRPMATTTDGQM